MLKHANAHPELAMGAIASGGAVYFNQDVIEMAGVTEAQMQTCSQGNKRKSTAASARIAVGDHRATCAARSPSGSMTESAPVRFNARQTRSCPRTIYRAGGSSCLISLTERCVKSIARSSATIR